MPTRANVDVWLFATAGLLVLVGLTMVGSASHYVAMNQGLDPHHYLVRQIVHAVVGVVCMILVLYLPYRSLMDPRVLASLMAVTVVTLLAVLAMPRVGGAHRWLLLGPLSMQPSEFAKLAAIVFMARTLARHEERVDDAWAVLVPSLAAVGTLVYLVALEPDHGSAAIIGLIAVAMIFVAGLRWKYVGAVAVLGTLGVVFAASRPYVVERIRAFVDPAADAHGASFQLTQSLIALGSGGLSGVGIGQGQQKAFFLPAPHTDFIFSVIGEELGLIGTGIVLAAFVVLLWRGLRTSFRAPDRFGFYLALGITSLLVFQGLINMGVCLGLMPTTGLTLPFISYGGSSLLATMIAMGILLNVSQHAG